MRTDLSPGAILRRLVAIWWSHFSVSLQPSQWCCHRVLHSVTECYRVLQTVTEYYIALLGLSSTIAVEPGAVTIYASSPRACNNHSPFIKPRSHLSDSSVPLDVRTSPVSNSRGRVIWLVSVCCRTHRVPTYPWYFPSSLPSPSRPESGFYSPTPELISTQPNTLTESLATKRGNFFCNTVQSFQIVLCTIR